MPENQRVRITKKMLKDSLIKLLKNDGIHNLTVKEICTGAEINRTTFYKYYGSPYDLFEELQNDVLSQINSYFDESKHRGMAAQTADALGFINDNVDICRILINNITDHEFPEKMIALQYFKHLVARRLDGKYNDEVLSYIYGFVIHGGYSIIRRWINKEERETPEEIAGLLNITIIKALV